MAAATPWPMPATTHARYSLGSATRTSSTRCVTPSWLLNGLRTSGADYEPADAGGLSDLGFSDSQPPRRQPQVAWPRALARIHSRGRSAPASQWPPAHAAGLIHVFLSMLYGGRRDSRTGTSHEQIGCGRDGMWAQNLTHLCLLKESNSL